MAKNLDTVFDVEQTLLRWRQQVAARKEVSDDGLRVTIDERPARTKWLTKEIVRESRHAQ